MSLTDNLVAYYKLDESSGNAADSVGSRTLTNTDVTYTTGKISNGAVFDGDSAKLVRSAEDLGITNAWTFTCWVKPAAADMTGKNILDIRPNSGAANYIGIQGVANMGVRVLFFNSSGSVIKDYKSSNNALVNGSWTFVCLSWDGTNFNIYINGSANNATKSTDNSGTMTNTNRSLYVGVEAGSGNWWNGMIDEVGYWSRALTADEITTLYNGGNGLPYEGFGGNLGEYLGAGSGITKGLWHLNGSSVDSSGNGNNGTDTNITYGLAYGKLGQGALFNGNSSKIATPVIPITNTSFTVSLWAKLTSVTATAYMFFAQGNTGSNNQIISLGTTNGTEIELVNRNDSLVGLATSFSHGMSAGIYYNISWVCTTTNSKLYINGKLLNDTNFTANSGTFNTQNIGVRQRVSYDSYMNGAIDEVIVENVAWSAEKVKKHYTYSKGRFGII